MQPVDFSHSNCASQELVSTVPARPAFIKSFTIKEEHYLWQGTAQTGCKPGSLCQAKSGELLAVWYGGGEYSGDESEQTCLWLARYKSGNWTEAGCLYKEIGYYIWNPVLFSLPSGKTMLFFRKFLPKVAEPQKEKYGVREFSYHIMESEDGGATWSTPQTLPEGPSKSPPLITSDGSWVMPCGANGAAFLQLSKDEGKSWQKIGPILTEAGQGEMTEPSLVQAADGTIVIFLRNRQKENNSRYVLRATFTPKTGTLSRAKPTNMPNPDSGIDVIALDDGSLLMAANPSQTERTPLALYISYNKGRTWNFALVLEDAPGAFAQPSLLKTDDGKIHVFYYWWPETLPNKNMKHTIVEICNVHLR